MNKDYRLYLVIKPHASREELLKSGEHFKLQSNKDLIESAFDNDVIMCLPVTTSINTPLFSGKYERLFDGLDLKSRGMFDLIGGITGKVAGIAKDKAGFVPGVDAASTFLSKVGKAVQAFSGNVESPLMWKNSELDEFKFAGAIGFDNFDEYKYFKACELMLLAMVTPTIAKEVKGIQEAINQLGDFSAQGVWKNITVEAMSPPPAACDMWLTILKTGEFTRPKIDVQAPGPTLLALIDAYLTAPSIKHGTEDGHGLDIYGGSRYVTYEFSFIPRQLSSVVEGLAAVMEANTYSQVDTRFDALPEDEPALNPLSNEPARNKAVAAAQKKKQYISAALMHSLNATTELHALAGVGQQYWNGISGVTDFFRARSALTFGRILV